MRGSKSDVFHVGEGRHKKSIHNVLVTRKRDALEKTLSVLMILLVSVTLKCI
jgi:hypothetical protein